MDTLLAPSTVSSISSWTIDPTHSRVRFALRQFMVATVRGSFREISGVVRAVNGDPRILVDVRIPVSSIRTGAAWRDAHLCSPAFFDAVSYPTITFLGRRIRGDPRAMFSVDGDLTVHGTTRDTILRATAKERVFDATGRLERASFHATTMIDRRDFGVMAPNTIEMGGLVVGREVRIDIDLDLIRTAHRSEGFQAESAFALTDIRD